MISGVIGVFSLGAALVCTYLTYKLAMATLQKQNNREDRSES